MSESGWVDGLAAPLNPHDGPNPGHGDAFDTSAGRVHETPNRVHVGMEHAIEHAARVVDDILCRDPQVAREMFGDEPDRIARALADAGLLAPAPLREEWGVRWDDHDIWGDMYNTRHEAETGAGDEGTPVHRYVTDWEEA